MSSLLPLESEELEHFRFIWCCLRLCHLWCTENKIVNVGGRSRKSKPITRPGIKDCDWFILLPLLPIYLSLDCKQWGHEWEWVFCFLLHQFDSYRIISPYVSDYDSDLTQLQVKTSLNWLQVLQMAWKMSHSLFIKYLTEWDEIQNPHLPKIILFIRSISLILYPKIMLIVIKNLDELIVFNFSLVWIKPYTMKHLHRNTQCLFQEISN